MTTDRITLAPWTIADADRLFDIRRRPKIAQWLGDPEPWVDVGRAHEAERLVLDSALAAGIETVWAIMSPANEASARVADRIGMTDLGVVADPWYGIATDPD